MLAGIAVRFTISFLQTNTYTFTNSVDPDDGSLRAVSSGSTRFVILTNPYLRQWLYQNSEMNEPTSETQVWKD